MMQHGQWAGHGGRPSSLAMRPFLSHSHARRVAPQTPACNGPHRVRTRRRRHKAIAVHRTLCKLSTAARDGDTTRCRTSNCWWWAMAPWASRVFSSRTPQTRSRPSESAQPVCTGAPCSPHSVLAHTHSPTPTPTPTPTPHPHPHPHPHHTPTLIPTPTPTPTPCHTHSQVCTNGV
jgi:hypothetical protein